MGVWRAAAAGLGLLLLLSGCAGTGGSRTALVGWMHRSAPSEPRLTLQVTATAYNSLPGQGLGDPTLAAWGDRLEPGMQAIAVSRDLLDMGLTHGVQVRIDGLPGVWTVLDKMARRWKRRIDLYMGVDKHAARRWGRQQVTIRWDPPEA